MRTSEAQLLKSQFIRQRVIQTHRSSSSNASQAIANGGSVQKTPKYLPPLALPGSTAAGEGGGVAAQKGRDLLQRAMADNTKSDPIRQRELKRSGPALEPITTAGVESDLPPEVRTNRFIIPIDMNKYRLDRRPALSPEARRAEKAKKVKRKHRRRKQKRRKDQLVAERTKLQHKRWGLVNQLERRARLKRQQDSKVKWDVKQNCMRLGNQRGAMFQSYGTATREFYLERKLRPFSPGHRFHSKGEFCKKWGRDGRRNQGP